MSEVNLEFLEKHDFNIDVEMERATLPLSKDGRIKLVIEDDKHSPKVIFNDGYCPINTDDFDMDNIVNAFKTLFKGQNTFPLF